MKFVRFALSIIFMCLSIICLGQDRYVYTISGNGQFSSTGDNGPAIDASFKRPSGIVKDGNGNLYISESEGYFIRKINAVTGNISTIAGLGANSYTGDGGPAIFAGVGAIDDMWMDPNGNIYLAEGSFHCIRKIDALTGIITTVVGTGVAGYSGDGGDALLAMISDPETIFGDVYGNLYIVCPGGVIRKVDGVTNIITTVAGTAGSWGYSGDGGLAINAQLSFYPGDIVVDGAGIIYYADAGNQVIRKVDVNGIITTFAGTGIQGFSGDGGLAINAEFNSPTGLAFDIDGNLLIGDNNLRIRKIDLQSNIITTIAGGGTNTSDGTAALSADIIYPYMFCVDNSNNIYYTTSIAFSSNKVKVITATPAYASDSFSVFVSKQCNGPHFTVTMPQYNSGYTVKTLYGNSETSTHTLTNTYNCGYANFIYTYSFPGTYPIKHILYNGINAIDSIEYTYEYELCRVMKTQFYFDEDNNCSFDENIDKQMVFPTLSVVDSNGICVDTISSTSGFYYEAKGNIGDVYSFRVLNTPGDLVKSCPVNGIMHDTLQSLYDGSINEIGLDCGSNNFDLRISTTLRAAANRSDIQAVISNEYCNAQNAVFTINYSSKYEYWFSSPPPTTQSATSASWSLNSLSGTVSNPNYIFLGVKATNGVLLTIGDTVITNMIVTPTTGDINPANNVVIRHDTVTGPYDPNAVYVSPTGCVVPGTKLEYTVTFENMGNAPAEDIYIMDTLSAGFDMQSMRILAASHIMNVTKVSNGGYNILKFEFSNINLPDSSSPDRHGMVMYTIDMLDNVPIGSSVTNKAGIYFDYMPAVLTNVASTGSCWPASVEEVMLGDDKIFIYPNPATSELTIKTEKQFTSFTITNSIGQVMMERDMKGKELKVDIKSLAIGIYYISLEGQGGSEVRKFVKL